jgi:hypothetical protein
MTGYRNGFALSTLMLATWAFDATTTCGPYIHQDMRGIIVPTRPRRLQQQKACEDDVSCAIHFRRVTLVMRTDPFWRFIARSAAK